MGNLHILQRGHRHPSLHIVEPTLLLYPRPLMHRFVTDRESGADFICAMVTFDAGHLNPIVQALPPMLAVPLAKMPRTQSTIELLSAEAFGQRHGRPTAVDRLFEVLLIQLLRKLIDEVMLFTGVLGGLSHPQLGKAIVALHQAPADHLTLDRLAAVAGMSRSPLASAFKATLGSTGCDYLCGCRLSLAQELLRRDKPLQQVAAEVGYASPIALTRVFKARLGKPPRAWRQSERLSARVRPDASARQT